MRDALLGGILIMLTVTAALLFQGAWKQMEEKSNPFNISNLKKAETEKLEILEERYKDRPERLEKYKTQYLSLARKDASAFVDKTVPMNKPHMSTTQIVTWLSFAISDIMTFGFNDYRSRLSLASEYFTESGWKIFMDTLKRSRILEMVTVNQQIITASPKGVPVLLSEGEVKGVYQWVVEIPMILTYRSGAKTKNTVLLVTVVIRRTNDPRNAYGIGIGQWIAMAR